MSRPVKLTHEGRQYRILPVWQWVTLWAMCWLDVANLVLKALAR